MSLRQPRCDHFTAYHPVDQDLPRKRKTVIFSTHRMGEVSLLSDDLAIIHNGKLIFNGTYKDFENQMQTRSVEDEFVRLVEAA